MARPRDLPPELPPDEDPETRELPPDRRRTRQYPVPGDPYAEPGYAEEEEVYEELPPEEPPPWWRRNLWIWLLLLLLVVVGGLLLLWLLQRDEDGGGDRAVVPAVVGMTEAQAVEEVDEAGLDPIANRVESTQPEGEVVSQTPGAGTQVAEGEPVVINVSRGPPPTTTVTTTTTETETVTTEPPPPPPANVTLPDVVGQNQVDAGEVLEEDGVVVDTYPVPSPEPAGTVVSQNPAPGTQIRQGQTVRLNVALGPDPRETSEIPDVTGVEASEGRQRARIEGFTVRTVYRDAPSDEEVGEVLTQSPAAGRSAPILTQITVFVGR